MNLHEYQTNFQHTYPDIGDIKAWTKADGEQLTLLGTTVGGKLVELRSKPQLTTAEETFIDRTMDLATRCVIYTHERFGIPIPESEHTIMVAEAIGRLQHTVPAPQHIVTGLHSITGSTYSLRSQSQFRAPIEDIGYGSLQMLGEMAEAANGIEIDDYLAGNLHNIIAHFEQAE